MPAGLWTHNHLFVRPLEATYVSTSQLIYLDCTGKLFADSNISLSQLISTFSSKTAVTHCVSTIKLNQQLTLRRLRLIALCFFIARRHPSYKNGPQRTKSIFKLSYWQNRHWIKSIIDWKKFKVTLAGIKPSLSSFALPQLLGNPASKSPIQTWKRRN